MTYFQVILVMPDQKKAQFKRLLEAGDGRVVNGR